jgi:hypothetical protein
MARKKTPADAAPEAEKPAKNPHAQALGKLGGLKGGKARAAKLTPVARAEIARKAAAARWKKAEPHPPSPPGSK